MFVLNDIGFMLKVYDLAKSRGKKTGDSIQDEFFELLDKEPDAAKFIGQTDQDIDMMTGNLREQGSKVININEIKDK